jgi:hypothetical protein
MPLPRHYAIFAFFRVSLIIDAAITPMAFASRCHYADAAASMPPLPFEAIFSPSAVARLTLFHFDTLR